MDEEDARTQETALAYARANKKAIAERVADPAVYIPEECPVSLFMAGSPGAGKTEASKALLKEVGGTVLRIDPDELRSEFGDYNGGNAWLFQGAISVLVDRIVDVALKLHQSFLLDGTLTNYEKAKQNVERSLRRRRPVQVFYVYQDPKQAWEFVQDRESLEGRHIALETFVRQYFEARKVVNCLKNEFGSSIKVDLLLKNLDGSRRFAKSNIDQIDNHVSEKYDPHTLLELLRSQDLRC